MQSTLCPPGLSLPGRYCGLPSEPPSVQTGPDGRITITGPIAIGATAAENFLMQDAAGLPPSQVAWGRLQGEAQIHDLLKIHRLEIDLAEKTLPIARQRGSNLLSQITATLQDGHNFPGMPRVAEPVRLAILVSHDNNLANIARLLNVGWQVGGFQPNELSPGGALAFELLREVRTNRRYVRLAFYAQTIAQMRNMTPLNLAEPPGMVAVDLPDCDPYLYDKACPIERFVEIANKAMEPGCVTAGKK
jgi:4-phytase/acid phosphatase